MDDAGLSVRRARPEELADCARVYVRVLTDTFTWLPSDRHSEADFLNAARDEEIYVALERGRILLHHVLAAAGGRLSLKCQAANTGAQAFYDREGFRCVEAGEDGGIAWLRFVRD